MSIYAKTKMKVMPGSCTECKLGERYGCVGDVKCLILREYFTGNVEPPYKERPDDCPLVELTSPPNDPLTLDELREMDGEPVWVKVSENWRESGVKDGWRLVRLHKSDNRLRLYFYDTHFGPTFVAEQDYVQSWLAYRRKPEEEQK